MTTHRCISPGRLFPVFILMGIAIICCFTGCFEQNDILVGFSGQLTGIHSGLGIQERNGVLLAFEEINARGGIDGRKIELLIQDDQGTPEGAKTADRALLEKKVVAIIGHATSAQTIAGLSVTNPAQKVMFSPTASTPELSGKDDYFFRVCGTCADNAHALARHICQSRGITRIIVLYDTDNAAYSQAFLNAFEEKFQYHGGLLAARIAFSSMTRPNFSLLAQHLDTGQTEGLLIIATDVDTALFAQRIRLSGNSVPLFATPWAQTETLISTGGQALDELEFLTINPLDNTSRNIDFKTRCHDRFGQAPSFGTVLGYETASVLARALKKNGGKAQGLAQALADIQNFKGLNDTFSLDQYGDAVRTHYLCTIRDGEYVFTKTLMPTRL